MSFLALCAFVNRLGLEASSGCGVACKIVNFAMLVPSALMQSMASFVSQNIGAGKAKRAKKSMFTGIGVGLVVGCIVFLLVMFGGDILAAFFTTDVAVIQKGYAYLKGLNGVLRLLNDSMQWVGDLPVSHSGDIHLSFLHRFLASSFWAPTAPPWIFSGVNGSFLRTFPL